MIFLNPACGLLKTQDSQNLIVAAYQKCHLHLEELKQGTYKVVFSIVPKQCRTPGPDVCVHVPGAVPLRDFQGGLGSLALLQNSNMARD